MKVDSKALATVSQLKREGGLSRAVLVTRATTSSEKIIYNLDEISPSDAEYFSLIIISKNDYT